MEEVVLDCVPIVNGNRLRFALGVLSGGIDTERLTAGELLSLGMDWNPACYGGRPSSRDVLHLAEKVVAGAITGLSERIAVLEGEQKNGASGGLYCYDSRLREYMDHKAYCQTKRAWGTECTCGLKRLLQSEEDGGWPQRLARPGLTDAFSTTVD